MSENAERPNVVFLFGAGASVDAGVPDTYQFVIDFEEDVKQNHQDVNELLVNILKVREKFNKKKHGEKQKQVDIEQLMFTLERLIKRNDDPLIDFYKKVSF